MLFFSTDYEKLEVNQHVASRGFSISDTSKMDVMLEVSVGAGYGGTRA
jgi:hypothetical protein